MIAEAKISFNKFDIHVDVSSYLMSSLRAIVICQKYFGNHVISSPVHPFAFPLLNMRVVLCELIARHDLLQYVALSYGLM